MSSRPEARRLRRTAALLPVLMFSTACASGAEDTDRVRSAPSATSSPAGSPESGTRLVVEGTAGPGVAPVRATLTCDPPGGDHPDPSGACADLQRAQDPFTPLSAAACTELYGGPQTAVVRGTYHGKPVELELSRTDGCRIAQWDALGAVLSALLPVGS